MMCDERIGGQLESADVVVDRRQKSLRTFTVCPVERDSWAARATATTRAPSRTEGVGFFVFDNPVRHFVEVQQQFICVSLDETFPISWRGGVQGLTFKHTVHTEI